MGFDSNFGGFGTKGEGGTPIDPDRLDPVNPASDGYPYTEQILDQVKSWERVVIVSGTSFSSKAKLQAGAVGDWVNGSYVGATSGVITDTFGGEMFTGQDATNSNYYLYQALANNVWCRTLLS